MSVFKETIRKKEEGIRQVLIPHEGRIMWIQGLLVWENPQYSAVLFVAVNIIFWLATCLRTFYIVGIVGFCLSTLDLWSHYVWPEIRVPPPPDADTEDWTPVHPKIMSVPEICHHIATVVAYTEYYAQRAVMLRKTKPAKFFVCSVSVLCCVAALGTYIHGVYISYSLVLGVMLFPVCHYHDLHTRLQDSLNPLIHRLEASMHIKRTKRIKKTKKRPMDESTESNMAEFTDSETEQLREFLPQMPPESEDLQLNLQVPENDSESTGLRPTPHTHDTHSEDEDTQMGGLPSEMPSISNLEDDSMDPRYALSSQSELSLGNVSDDDSLADGLSIGFDSDVDGIGRKVSKKVSLEKQVLLSQAAAVAPAVPAKSPTPPLEFMPQYFEEEGFSAASKKKATRKSSKKSNKKLKEKHTTLEEELAQGLDFDGFDDEEQEVPETGGNSGMGGLLAGALSGAQDTVASLVASHMVSSLMESTVGGVSRGMSRLGESVGLAPAGGAEGVEKGSMEERVTEKGGSGGGPVGGGGPQGAECEEFEFLSEEDFDNVEGGGRDGREAE